MKKLLTTIFLLSAMITMAQKTVSMHMYINVAPENQETFERLEIDYWSKVAKEEIKKGNMTGWGLMKILTGARSPAKTDTWSWDGGTRTRRGRQGAREQAAPMRGALPVPPQSCLAGPVVPPVD